MKRPRSFVIQLQEEKQVNNFGLKIRTVFLFHSQFNSPEGIL